MKNIFCLSCLLASCLIADDVAAFIKKSEVINFDGKQVGSVDILTPIKILKSDNNKVDILIEGYTQEYYQEKLVRSHLLNEEYVYFSVDGEKPSYEGDINPYINIKDKIEDKYGEVWFKAEFRATVPKDSIIKDPNKLYLEAKNMYEQTCSACHTLHEPTKYTVNQWPSHIESMISSGFVALEALNKNMIIKYLQHNAKDVVKK
ncbi:hypothetical protein BFG05_02495 [Campylobacter pinnipediorum subsp. pinnipediorum]|uniref:hypothetical protein n=1 Tax=Campylobacter pinnipediorum TaxID=1965231 RepID=UPI0009956039|nr:hypothetical protein [Campylobacter pinnipediorum]OPA78099.1 hypothetical protein BFG05_02495 [Campylobacter pinnipediorum subsp. pinnipediorum]